MKKILLILGVISLTSTAASAVVSCGTSENLKYHFMNEEDYEKFKDIVEYYSPITELKLADDTSYDDFLKGINRRKEYIFDQLLRTFTLKGDIMTKIKLFSNLNIRSNWITKYTNEKGEEITSSKYHYYTINNLTERFSKLKTENPSGLLEDGEYKPWSKFTFYDGINYFIVPDNEMNKINDKTTYESKIALNWVFEGFEYEAFDEGGPIEMINFKWEI